MCLDNTNPSPLPDLDEISTLLWQRHLATKWSSPSTPPVPPPLLCCLPLHTLFLCSCCLSELSSRASHCFLTSFPLDFDFTTASHWYNILKLFQCINGWMNAFEKIYLRQCRDFRSEISSWTLTEMQDKKLWRAEKKLCVLFVCGDGFEANGVSRSLWQWRCRESERTLGRGS
jgi:hypothetical protein